MGHQKQRAEANWAKGEELHNRPQHFHELSPTQKWKIKPKTKGKLLKTIVRQDQNKEYNYIESDAICMSNHQQIDHQKLNEREAAPAEQEPGPDAQPKEEQTQSLAMILPYLSILHYMHAKDQI